MKGSMTGMRVFEEVITVQPLMCPYNLDVM